MENTAKKRIQTRIVSASAVKRELDFRFALPLTLKMFRQKETPIGYYTLINLRLQKCGKTYVSGENLRLLNRKCFLYLDQHRLHLLTHFLQCRVSSNTSVRILQTATYNRNFIVPLLLLSRISLNWSAPDSIRCFISGE